MAELFIGNATKQINNFAYRSLERPGIVVQIIQIGGQIKVAPTGSKTDLTQMEIDHIIDQHRMYGIRDILEIESKGTFGGLVYSIGKPISAEKLRRAMLKMEEQLDEEGRKIRQEAALAVNSQIEERVGTLRNLEMSFEEIEPRSGFSDDASHIAEGIRVSRDAPEGITPFSGRKRRAN